MRFKSMLVAIACCMVFVGVAIGKSKNTLTITCESGYATKHRHHAWELKEISGSPCIYVTVGNGGFKQVSHIVDIGGDKFSVYVDGKDFLVTFKLYDFSEFVKAGKPVTSYVLDKEYVAHHYATIRLYVPAGSTSLSFRKALDALSERSESLAIK